MRNKGRLFILFSVSLLWLPACVNVPKFVPGQVDADIDADFDSARGSVDQGVEMGLDSAPDVMDQSVQDAFTETDVTTLSDEGVPSPLIQITASRDSGVAPLLMHFSVEPVGDAISQRDLYNAEYQWTLGGGALQETSYEPVAVQIYDFEGAGDAGENVATVEVSVTVTLPNDGGTLSASTTVSVEDPDERFSGEKTVCYAKAIGGADVDYEGCPDDALKPDFNGRPFSEVFDSLAGLAGRRILFRRGQTFQLGTETIELTENHPTSPIHIGAFGTDGERPILRYSGTEYPMRLNRATDVRIQSLAFELPSAADLQSNEPIPDVKPIVVLSTSHQVLIDDTRMLGIRSKSDSPQSNEGLEDSAITRSSIAPRLNDGANLSEINLKVDRFAFVENQVMGRENVRESGASHVNLVTGDSLLVRKNHWSAREGGQADSLLKLSLIPIDRCPPQTLITDNALVAGEFHQIVDLAPAGQYGDEPCEGEIRFERNHLTWRNNDNPFHCMDNCSRSMLTLGSTGAWIRNNILISDPLVLNKCILNTVLILSVQPTRQAQIGFSTTPSLLVTAKTMVPH